jgi:Ser/Thr protein kinase RdoA (MazF antagonist)
MVPLLYSDEQLLVFPWIDGAIVSSLQAGSDAELLAYKAAGRFAAALRGCSCEADDAPGEMPLTRALAMRFEGALARVDGLLAPLELERVAERWRSQPWPEAMERTHAHRDFEASNWIVDGRGALWVIDFGQSRPDYWLWDLVKLEADAFAQKPARRDAFLGGLGQPLSAEESTELEALVLLHGLQTLGWAVEHGARELELLARGILALGH